MKKVRREDDHVWIEGIRGWGPGDLANSVMAAWTIAMQSIGEEVSYEQLMGASGSAFRLQVHERWCPSSPHSFCGMQCVAGAVAALPWELTAYEAKEDDEKGVRATREAVVASIDAGVPAVYGSEEDGLIVGYRKGGEEWLCVHPCRKSDPFHVERDWPWGVGVFSARREPPPDLCACAVKALKLAVRLATAEKEGEYFLGYSAYGHWIGTLGDEERFAAPGEEDRMLGNAWIFASLIEARRCAATYLRYISGWFGEDVSPPLRRAADCYEELSGKVLGREEVRAAVPSPWDLGEGEEWTPDQRRKQAAALEVALVLEREAMGEIVAALGGILDE